MAWAVARLSRRAFSEAGHSVTSGLVELALMLHLARGVGSLRGTSGSGAPAAPQATAAPAATPVTALDRLAEST